MRYRFAVFAAAVTVVAGCGTPSSPRRPEFSGGFPAYDQLIRSAARPLLVHCANGNRVGAIAALRAAWIDGESEEEAVAIGRAWGLKGLEPEVRERIRATRESNTSQR